MASAQEVLPLGREDVDELALLQTQQAVGCITWDVDAVAGLQDGLVAIHVELEASLDYVCDLRVGMAVDGAETDSPYLAPEPLRGSLNTPKNVVKVYEKLSTLRGVPLETLAAQIYENAHALFPKLRGNARA